VTSALSCYLRVSQDNRLRHWIVVSTKDEAAIIVDCKLGEPDEALGMSYKAITGFDKRLLLMADLIASNEHSEE
jgi:hypothetical protein